MAAIHGSMFKNHMVREPGCHGPCGSWGVRRCDMSLRCECNAAVDVRNGRMGRVNGGPWDLDALGAAGGDTAACVIREGTRPRPCAAIGIGGITGGGGARCRVRTCDFLRVKQALYH